MSNQNQPELAVAESAEFEQLLKGGLKIPKVGDVIEAVVLNVSKNEAHLDIEGYGTGIVRGPEFLDESGEYSALKNGDRVYATILELENESGEMELSFREAGHKKAWETLQGYLRKGEVVDAKVSDANRGGLMVSIGQIAGFLPVSQLIAKHYPRVEGGDKNKILEKLKTYVGQIFRVKVIDLLEGEDKLIVSERGAWETDEKEKISQYKVGDMVEGKVVGVVDFGAFVEFGDHLEGLIHISELSWDRVNHPSEILRAGQTVKVQILSIDGTKISLTMKRLTDDPWKKIAEVYAVGQKVQGKITKINPFGLFVELDQPITALCHISEIPNATPQ
ncbi:MAG TPA: S1 RNA-binding domain-containing protein, partial [Patescibacteria group bacterium]|nr:S1 RNA-binding domain-containing protein [Patescibacteria group bacterium]